MDSGGTGGGGGGGGGGGAAEDAAAEGDCVAAEEAVSGIILVPFEPIAMYCNDSVYFTVLCVVLCCCVVLCAFQGFEFPS